MPQQDLAGIKHWDTVYRGAQKVHPGWRPWGYDSQTLEHALMTQIERWKPRSILEVGCGNSVWLPYLAHKTGAAVAGIDYSEQGCELVRQRLAIEGVEGKIFCVDMFEADTTQVGQYDFVYSLGVVEHFTDLEKVLSKLLSFVAPGGVLFTEVPNLRSIHGLLSWIWQPELLAKHELVSKGQLIRAYKRLGLTDVSARYAGLFSLNIVAWELYQRWPKLGKRVVPPIRTVHRHMDYRLGQLGIYRGIAPLSPFLYVVGQKPL